jgi:glutamyl-Q tRNA(Asp) synthetase
MSYVGRFAPSPTGPLHFGSLLAAVASYLDARARDGRWRLRMEDIDETRCRPEFADDILRTLEGFGFEWDGEVSVQSQRKPWYEAALAQLAAQKVVYACTCSRREIADSALAGIDGPVYPGTCRHARHPAAGNALRILTQDAPIAFTDRVQGAMVQHLESQIGDFVVKRRDGLFAYQLAVVVDDHLQGVTDVVRGADLLDSTARQIWLQQQLGYATPSYLHIPVATNAAGQKLSKQTLAPQVADGDACRTLLSALALLGQPLDGLDTIPQPGALLLAAGRRWDPLAIPRRRAIPQSGDPNRNPSA